MVSLTRLLEARCRSVENQEAGKRFRGVKSRPRGGKTESATEEHLQVMSVPPNGKQMQASIGLSDAHLL